MQLKNVLLATTALAVFSGVNQAQAGGMYIGLFGGANWLSDSSASFATTNGGEG